MPSLSQEQPPFPLTTFVGVIVTILAYFIAINVIFSYVPFMVKDFFGGKLEDDEIGRYAGYLESIYFLGNVLASMIWSRFSDKYGRRPALIFSLIGTTSASVVFGMSQNFAMALGVRFVWGALDGTLGVAKTVIGEIATKDNRTRLYSVFSVVSGVGRLVANLIGGFFALGSAQRHKSNPLIKMLEKIRFLRKFPYFFPSLVSAGVSFIALGLVSRFVKETAVTLNRPDRRTTLSLDPDMIDEPHYKTTMVMDPDSIILEESERRLTFDRRTTTERYYSINQRAGSTVMDRTALLNASTKTLPPEVAGLDDEAKLNGNLESDGTHTLSDSLISERTTSTKSIMEFEERLPTIRDILGIRDAMVACSLYGVMSFIGTGWQAVFPLWVLQDRKHGGFGWDSSNIGSVFAVIGPTYTASQLILFPYLAKKLGYMTLFRSALVVFSVFTLVLPHTSNFKSDLSDTALFFLVVFIASVSFTLRVMCSSITVVFINNSTHPTLRATANGFGQSVSAMGRILAPVILAPLFTWSIMEVHKHQYDALRAWPFNFCFTWYLLSGMGLVVICVSFFFNEEFNPEP